MTARWRVWGGWIGVGVSVASSVGCGADVTSANPELTCAGVDASAAIDTEEAFDDASEGVPADATIVFSSGGATVEGTGASVSGGVVTITQAGVFHVSGTSSDGQLLVVAPEDASVSLVLDGLSLTSASSAPVWIQQAEEVEIFLVAGTTSTLEDASSYTLEDGSDEPNAALFSAEDLTIRGPGSLVVTAHYNDGISSKDTLKIANGALTVSAPDDGLRGKDAVKLKGGALEIDAGGDGVSSDNEEDAGEGVITLDGAALTITAGDDAFDAISSIAVTSGALTADAGGDALHSDGAITLSDGAVCVSATDDGLHAEGLLQVDGGALTVTHAYEGLEGTTITLNGGAIRVATDDDGLNASDTSSVLTINGGTLTVYAAGDGIDSNGDIVINGGVTLVHGPTEDMNGPMDYGDQGASFTVNGGVLVAVGSAGMAVAPGTASTQRAVLAFLDDQDAGALVRLEDDDGTPLLTFAPAKSYASVLFSAPTLQAGDYSLRIGGSCDGDASGGLYDDDCTYKGGDEVEAFTISSGITQVGERSSSGAGGGPGGR